MKNANAVKGIFPSAMYMLIYFTVSSTTEHFHYSIILPVELWHNFETNQSLKKKGLNILGEAIMHSLLHLFKREMRRALKHHICFRF